MSANDKVYQIVTERVIEALQNGTAPWQMPWMVKRHKNGMKGNEYRGINRLLTSLSAFEAEQRGEHYSHLWLTFKQVNALGGKVRKGEHSTLIVLWKPIERKTDQQDDDGNPVVDTIWLLRYYRVFNLAQTEDVTLPAKIADEMEANGYDHGDPDEAEQQAQAMWDAWTDKPAEQVSDRAWYRPATDTIGIPEREAFVTPAAFWATRFHEGVHSTGHKDRLNRPEVGKSDGFGGESYSREELVAEMGAAFLLADVGLLTEHTFENSAAYIANWLKALQDDPRMVVSAAGKAEAAARYIAPVPEVEHSEAAA